MRDNDLLGVVQQLAARVRKLEADAPARDRWATVTGTSPLRVQLDGEADPLPVTPETIGYAPADGDRVLVTQVGRRLVVHAAPDRTEANFERLRLSSTSDASPTSTAHALQIGDTGGYNLIADNNEIIARLNGERSHLNLLDNIGVNVPDPSNDVHAINHRTLHRHPTLWSGAWFMHGTQTAHLSENVADQPNGIILVWGAYNGGVENHNYSYHTVSKYHVQNFNGYGVKMLLDDTASGIVKKYVYVLNDRITGNAANDDAPNNARVLRAVVGF